MPAFAGWGFKTHLAACTILLGAPVSIVLAHHVTSSTSDGKTTRTVMRNLKLHHRCATTRQLLVSLGLEVGNPNKRTFSLSPSYSNPHILS